MDYSQNLYSFCVRTIKHKDFSESRDAKNAHILKVRVFQAGTPAHQRLSGKHGKRLMCGKEEAVAEFGACLGCEIVGLVVEVSIRLGANQVDSAHGRSDCFKRLSRSLCFSDQ
jgi:hypothetical protein